MKLLKTFKYSCVECTRLRELEYIIDHSREIKYETFKRNVEPIEFQLLIKQLGYEKYGLKIKDDWHVRYYSSKNLKGEKVYYIDHSSIEYVFY